MLFDCSETAAHCQHLLSLLLKHSSKRRPLKQIHSHLIATGLLVCRPALSNALLRRYSLTLFPQDAFFLFQHLRRCRPSSFFFDSFAYCSLLNACANLRHLKMGIQLHALTFKAGFHGHLYVQTSVVGLYGFCGLKGDARRVFDEMPERSSVTWNVFIIGLIDMGELGLARALFERMPGRNVVSWSAVIGGYSRNNQPGKALSLFRRMHVQEGVKPNEVTVLGILPSVCNLGDLCDCHSIHAYAHKCGLLEEPMVKVKNSLVDAYAKCGCMRSASRVFHEITPKGRTLVSWTVIISGFAMHGMAEEAVKSFRRMVNACVKPNRVTLLSILNACSHGGLVSEGLEFFNKMVEEWQIVPDIQHYGCLIDMLGRAGRLEEAETIALEIPSGNNNVVIWRTILGACNSHGYAEMAERVMSKIIETERTCNADYVLMSNIFTGARKFIDAQKIRRSIDESDCFKSKGISLV